jgi:putative ABC transport system permease protein
MSLVLLGTAVGLVLSLASMRLMSGLLCGVSTTDLGTFAGVPILLVIVALLACAVPALRAARVDPTVALKYE